MAIKLFFLNSTAFPQSVLDEMIQIEAAAGQDVAPTEPGEYTVFAGDISATKLVVDEAVIPDPDPAVLYSMTDSPVSPTTGTARTYSNRVGGLMYAVALPDSSEPTAAQIIAGTDTLDLPAVWSGSKAVVSTGPGFPSVEFDLTGLVENQFYRVHFVQVIDGLISNVVRADGFVTPTIVVTGESEVPNRDISITFDRSLTYTPKPDGSIQITIDPLDKPKMVAASTDGASLKNGMMWDTNAGIVGFNTGAPQAFDFAIRQHQSQLTYNAAKNVHPDVVGEFEIPGEGVLLVAKSLDTPLPGEFDLANMKPVGSPSTTPTYGRLQREQQGSLADYYVYTFVYETRPANELRCPVRGTRDIDPKWNLDTIVAAREKYAREDWSLTDFANAHTPAARSELLAKVQKFWSTSYTCAFNTFSHYNQINANLGYGRGDAVLRGDRDMNLQSNIELDEWVEFAVTAAQQALDEWGMFHDGGFLQAKGNWSTNRAFTGVHGGILLNDMRLINVALADFGTDAGNGQTVHQPVNTETLRYGIVQAAPSVEVLSDDRYYRGFYPPGIPPYVPSIGRARLLPLEDEHVGIPVLITSMGYGKGSDEQAFNSSLSTAYSDNILGSNLRSVIAMQLFDPTKVSFPQKSAIAIAAVLDRYTRILKKQFDNEFTASGLVLAEWSRPRIEYYISNRSRMVIPEWFGKPEEMLPPSVEVRGSVAIVTTTNLRVSHGGSLVEGRGRYRAVGSSDPWTVINNAFDPAVKDAIFTFPFTPGDPVPEVQICMVSDTYGAGPWSTNLSPVDVGNSNKGKEASEEPRGVGWVDNSDPAFAPETYIISVQGSVTQGEDEDDPDVIEPQSQFTTTTVPTGTTSLEIGYSFWLSAVPSTGMALFEMLTHDVECVKTADGWKIRVEDSSRSVVLPGTIWNDPAGDPVVLDRREWYKVRFLIDAVAQSVRSWINDVEQQAMPFTTAGNGFLRDRVNILLMGGVTDSSKLPPSSRFADLYVKRNGETFMPLLNGDAAAANASPRKKGADFVDPIVYGGDVVVTDGLKLRGHKSVTGFSSSGHVISLTDLSGGTGPSAKPGDLVIVHITEGATTQRFNSVNTSGYTRVVPHGFGNSSRDINSDIFSKFMGPVADTTVSITGGNFSGNGLIATVTVWSGVDAVTPFDVAGVNTDGNTSPRPNPGAITPVTPGAVILTYAASGFIPLNDPGDLVHATLVPKVYLRNAEPAFPAMHWISVTPWVSGAFDPVAFTTATTSTDFSWIASQIALKPKP